MTKEKAYVIDERKSQDKNQSSIMGKMSEKNYQDNRWHWQ